MWWWDATGLTGTKSELVDELVERMEVPRVRVTLSSERDAHVTEMTGPMLLVEKRPQVARLADTDELWFDVDHEELWEKVRVALRDVSRGRMLQKYEVNCWNVDRNCESQKEKMPYWAGFEAESVDAAELLAWACGWEKTKGGSWMCKSCKS